MDAELVAKNIGKLFVVDAHLDIEGLDEEKVTSDLKDQVKLKGVSKYFGDARLYRCH